MVNYILLNKLSDFNTDTDSDTIGTALHSFKDLLYI